MIQRFLDKIKLIGIKAICFDFDLTLTKVHTAKLDSIQSIENIFFFKKDGTCFVKDLLTELIKTDIKLYITSFGVNEKIVNYIKKIELPVDEISFNDIKQINVITPKNIINIETGKPYIDNTTIEPNKKKCMYELVKFHSKNEEHQILILDDDINNIINESNYHFCWINYIVHCTGITNNEMKEILKYIESVYFNMMLFEKFKKEFVYPTNDITNEIVPNNCMKFVQYNDMYILIKNSNNNIEYIYLQFNGSFVNILEGNNITQIIKSFRDFEMKFNTNNLSLYHEDKIYESIPSILSSYYDDIYFKSFIDKYLVRNITAITAEFLINDKLNIGMFKLVSAIVFRKSSISGHYAITIRKNNKFGKYLVKINGNKIDYINHETNEPYIILSYNDFINEYKNHYIYSDRNETFSLLQ